MHPNIELIIAYKQAHPTVNWDVNQIVMERDEHGVWAVTGHRAAEASELSARMGFTESLTDRKRRLGIPLEDRLEEYEYVIPLRRKER